MGSGRFWPLVSLVVRQPLPEEFVVRLLLGEGQVVDVSWSVTGPQSSILVDFCR